MSDDRDSNREDASRERGPKPEVLRDLNKLGQVIKVDAVSDQVRAGWWPSLVAVAMVGISFWWAINDWYPISYWAVNAIVCLLLYAGWRAVYRRDRLTLHRLNAQPIAAIFLWVGAAGVLSRFLGEFFATDKSSLFPPAASTWQSVVQSVTGSISTSIVEETACAVVVLAVAAFTSLYWPLKRFWLWVAIGSGAVVRVLLHIPLWGISDAIVRSGFALIMAWLFWRIRRIWPLIAVHFAWDFPQIIALTWPTEGAVPEAATLIYILWLCGGFVALCFFVLVTATNIWFTWRNVD
jgi:membrane protease YdiL (CAAX protease family)